MRCLNWPRRWLHAAAAALLMSLELSRHVANIPLPCCMQPPCTTAYFPACQPRSFTSHSSARPPPVCKPHSCPLNPSQRANPPPPCSSLPSLPPFFPWPPCKPRSHTPQLRLQRQAERTLELLELDQAKLQDEMTSAQGAFSESLEALGQVS